MLHFSLVQNANRKLLHLLCIICMNVYIIQYFLFRKQANLYSTNKRAWLNRPQSQAYSYVYNCVFVCVHVCDGKNTRLPRGNALPFIADGNYGLMNQNDKQEISIFRINNVLNNLNFVMLLISCSREYLDVITGENKPELIDMPG